jgi:hypothetical protein
MDAGIVHITRETFASSLEMAAAVLSSLGQPDGATQETVRRFRALDEETLMAQYAVKDDEEKFLATSQAAARQVEQLFEADEEQNQGAHQTPVR